MDKQEELNRLLRQQELLGRMNTGPCIEQFIKVSDRIGVLMDEIEKEKNG